MRDPDDAQDGNEIAAGLFACRTGDDRSEPARQARQPKTMSEKR